MEGQATGTETKRTSFTIYYSQHACREDTILLNLQLRVRISGEGAEMPPTIPSKPLKSTIFSRAFDRRPAAEKILSKFDMFSDSFVLAADKSRISLTIF